MINHEYLAVNTRKANSIYKDGSFRFIAGFAGDQSFTARKEPRKEGEADYWYGYRKVEGKLHKRYIGKFLDVKLDRLKTVAFALSAPATPRKQSAKVKPGSYLNKSVTSDDISQLGTELQAAQLKVTKLQLELGFSTGGVRHLKDEAESFRQESQQLPNFEAVRDRILYGLKLGKQAPGYKRTKAAIDRFISELRSL